MRCGVNSQAKANGAIIYRGPSMLDGAPIVVVATGLAKGSNNSKTGAGLIQTWILRDDVSPTDAVNTGADASICGACPHRGDLVAGRNVNRSCYVTVFQAPLNVWKSVHRGIYADVSDNLTATFAGRGVRLGAYGDPAAVPLAVWHAVLAEASFWTGYTHQWKDCDRGYADYCMASADSEGDRQMAGMLGFRTFRVRAASEPKLDREVPCPASHEAGQKTNCDACRACGGNTAKARADIVIVAHGAASKINAHARRIAA
jgi:hypothetical protein